MQEHDVLRAIAAATSTASELGLVVTETVVLQNSNRLIIRFLPCNVVVRIAPLAHQVAQFELELVERLAESESPVAALELRVSHRVYQRDGFTLTFWVYYAPLTTKLAPDDYANALSRLHTGMRKIEIATPHFTDRVAEAEQLLANHQQTPELTDEDRTFLLDMLISLRRTIIEHGAAEQLLHGEPHPGNVLSTKSGPLFIDFETCCRGPIEFDLAHVPEAIVEHYPGVDRVLLSECRALVLAMVAAWRWDAEDQFPNGRQWAQQFISTLRQGEPWPSLDAMARQLA